MRNIFFKLSILTFLASCKTNKEDIKTDWEKLNLNGTVQTTRLKIYSVDNPDLIDLTTEKYNSSQVIEFNKKGLVTEVISNSDAEGQNNRIFKYDSSDRKISVELFGKGKFQGAFNYKYNGPNLIEINSTFPDGSTSETIKYEYDNNGNKIKKTVQKANGYIYSLKKYDDVGNIIEDKYDGHYTYKFQDKKYLIEKNTLDENGIVIKTETFPPEKKITITINRLEEEYDPGSVNYINYEEFEKMGKCGEKIETKDLKIKKECDNKSNWVKISRTENNSNQGYIMVREILYY